VTSEATSSRPPHLSQATPAGGREAGNLVSHGVKAPHVGIHHHAHQVVEVD